MRSTGLLSSISRWAGTAPLAVPPHVVVISRRELVYASWTRLGDGLRLEELASAELGDGVFGSGPLGAPGDEGLRLERAVATLWERLRKRPKALSVVLPDAWMRVMMVEFGALPARPPEARTEILRFRLRKLVPYRVDELRLSAVEVRPLPGREEPIRAAVGFASEALASAVERAFAAAGARVGQITNATLADLAALTYRGRIAGPVTLARVAPEGFTLVVAADGEPVVYRQKGFTEGLADADRAVLLERELKLTRSFLADEAGVLDLGPVFLAAPREVEPFWSGVLTQGLGRPPIRLALEHLPVEVDGVPLAAAELASAAGAAALEVA